MNAPVTTESKPCKVCGALTRGREETQVLCGECQRWKQEALRRMREEARREAFGDVWRTWP